MIAEGGIAAKLIGVVAGAFLALVFIPPKTFPTFLRRGSAAVVFGLALGNQVHSTLGFSEHYEGVIGAYCVASFASWWLLGALKRAADAFGVKD